MGHGILLGFRQIPEQGAGRYGPGRVIRKPHLVQAFGFEVGFQGGKISLIAKIGIIHAKNADAQPVLKVLDIYAAHPEGFVADDLGGDVAADLIHHLARILRLGDKAVAGADIGDSAAKAALQVDNGHQVIVTALIQGPRVQVGSRRDHADDLAPDQPLGQLRVLHLLADGHLVAALHQTVDVAFGGVVGNAAHGGALGKAAVLAGQGDLQLFGDQKGIVKEHLVKIAQAVEQYAVLIFFFCFQVLLHHRR